MPIRVLVKREKESEREGKKWNDMGGGKKGSERRAGVRQRGTCETGKIRASQRRGGPRAKQRRKVNTGGTNKSAGTKQRERKRQRAHKQTSARGDGGGGLENRAERGKE